MKLTSSVLQATAFSYEQLVIGRFVGGIGVGVLSATAPMYISEISPPNVRGAFLALEGSSIVIGIVIMYLIVSLGSCRQNSLLDLRYPSHHERLEFPNPLCRSSSPL
jgi:MFS family permease